MSNSACASSSLNPDLCITSSDSSLAIKDDFPVILSSSPLYDYVVDASSLLLCCASFPFSRDFNVLVFDLCDVPKDLEAGFVVDNRTYFLLRVPRRPFLYSIFLFFASMIRFPALFFLSFSYSFSCFCNPFSLFTFRVAAPSFSYTDSDEVNSTFIYSSGEPSGSVVLSENELASLGRTELISFDSFSLFTWPKGVITFSFLILMTLNPYIIGFWFLILLLVFLFNLFKISRLSFDVIDFRSYRAYSLIARSGYSWVFSLCAPHFPVHIFTSDTSVSAALNLACDVGCARKAFLLELVLEESDHFDDLVSIRSLS